MQDSVPVRSSDEKSRKEKKMASDFPIWKTITLGAYKDTAAYCAALEAARCRVSDYAREILKKISIAQSETPVDLARLTVRELGFPEGATTEQAYAAALTRGLTKCPAEVGPALRLAYMDQPFGELIRVGMEPIVGSDGNLNVFRVVRGSGGRWLRASWAGPTGRWSPEVVWVFLRSKQ